MLKNIHYSSNLIEEHYKSNRVTWNQFYESEKAVIQNLGLNSSTSVLDIGCGCAGLGLALIEKFNVSDYTGVEINYQAAETAKKIYPNAKIVNSDVLTVSQDDLPYEKYDVVFSLSCIDWNIQFSEMFEKAFSYVRNGGYFVASFRITENETVSALGESYQYINFEGIKEGEIAPYVVLNINDLMNYLKKLHPSQIYGYGYWGKPSGSAVTPYNKICFAVFSVKKKDVNNNDPEIQLDLPHEILLHLQN